ncbi:MAG: hypothetical protein KME45_26545 [Stenomitos rutilans HA7619-LM2]|jgi:glycine betaine/proline transport system substrate-binding protein|nr:hypothetical protein [Stenomitos rutilans HA7619-LM2]
MKRKQFVTALAVGLPMSTILTHHSLSQTAARPQTIVLGQVGLSFYQVKAALIQILLERLSYGVTVREGPHEQIFPLLGTGEVDLLVAAWLPEAHANYWNAVKYQAVQLATLYENAYFFWGVPDYVPEAAVRSIADLAKPDVAAQMTKTIQGIGAGATISVVSQQAIINYGLDHSTARLSKR